MHANPNRNFLGIMKQQNKFKVSLEQTKLSRRKINNNAEKANNWPTEKENSLEAIILFFLLVGQDRCINIFGIVPTALYFVFRKI